jgi:hypothetical protein
LLVDGKMRPSGAYLFGSSFLLVLPVQLLEITSPKRFQHLPEITYEFAHK